MIVLSWTEKVQRRFVPRFASIFMCGASSQRSVLCQRSRNIAIMAAEEIVCSEHQAPEKPTPAKGLRYDVPIIRKHEQDIHQLEALLLAWALLLYRHSNGQHVQFSWGLSETGARTNNTFELSTSRLPWGAADSISIALEGIRGYLRQQLQSETPIAADRYTFFFNDECAPDGSVSHVNETGDHSIGWVRSWILASTVL